MNFPSYKRNCFSFLFCSNLFSENVDDTFRVLVETEKETEMIELQNYKSGRYNSLEWILW